MALTRRAAMRLAGMAAVAVAGKATASIVPGLVVTQSAIRTSSSGPRIVILGTGFSALSMAKAIRAKNQTLEVVLIGAPARDTHRALDSSGGRPTQEEVLPSGAYQTEDNITVLEVFLHSVDREGKQLITNLGPVSFDSLVLAADSAGKPRAQS